MRRYTRTAKTARPMSEDKKKRRVTFVTAQELDPLTAICLNARFVGFLAHFAAEKGLDVVDTLVTAQNLLREAGIPQDGDQLLDEGEAVIPEDMEPFNI
jgi:hypothetical protein